MTVAEAFEKVQAELPWDLRLREPRRLADGTVVHAVEFDGQALAASLPVIIEDESGARTVGAFTPEWFKAIKP